MNNKGFMMAEVVVVSAIIIVTLTALYVSYNKIISLYNQRVDYYDVRTLYELDEYRRTALLTTPNTYPKKDGTIYYTRKKLINTILSNPSNHSAKFQDYIQFLSTTLENIDSENCILIMERCIDNDNCKYAYLEVDCS